MVTARIKTHQQVLADELAALKGPVAVLGLDEAMREALPAKTRVLSGRGVPDFSRLLHVIEKPKGATVVVADAIGSHDELNRLLDVVAARNHRLVLSFWNVSGAAAIVRSFAGVGQRTGALTDDVVREQFARAGLEVVSRHGTQVHAEGNFAAETEHALASLARQLNPCAVDDRLIYVVQRSRKVTPTRAFVPGLLSVVMRNHSSKRLALLDQAIFSLAASRYQPLEIVLVTQSTESDVVEKYEELLERYRPLGGFSSKVIQVPTTQDIRAKLINVGVDAATGQYLAFLDDDDVVYPEHFERLIGALKQAPNAWAFARTRRAYFTRDSRGDLYCYKKDYFPRSEALDLAQLLHDNYVTCHSYVIDRTRVGRMQLHFEETLTKSEDYMLLLRLLAAFRPLALGDHASCEYRIRDDGTNTIVTDVQSQELRQKVQAEWNKAITLKNGLRDPLQMLMSEGAFLLEVRSNARPDIFGPAEPPVLRYRIADFANKLLKAGLPSLHSTLKGRLEPKK